MSSSFNVSFKIPNGKYLPTWDLIIKKKKKKSIAREFHSLQCLGGFLHLKPTSGYQLLVRGDELHKYFLNSHMSIQGVEYVLKVLFLLLVARHFQNYILLLSLVLRHIALLVGSFHKRVMRTKFYIYVFIFIGVSGR